jgi:hypothetical protein
MMTREQLADVLDVTPRTIKEWTSSVFPTSVYTLSGKGQSAYEYSPRAAVIGQLMVELGEVFGSNSPLPKRITEKVVAELDRLEWSAAGSKATLTVTLNNLEIRMSLGFLKVAQEKLSALA